MKKIIKILMSILLIITGNHALAMTGFNIKSSNAASPIATSATPAGTETKKEAALRAKTAQKNLARRQSVTPPATAKQTWAKTTGPSEQAQLTKAARTTAGLQKQVAQTKPAAERAEEITEGLFAEPSIQENLDQAFQSTFTQIPGGKDWATAFSKINLQAWNKAIADATKTLKANEADALNKFNVRLANFIKQGGSPTILATLEDNIAKFIGTAGSSGNAKTIAQAIKKATDTLMKRINR